MSDTMKPADDLAPIPRIALNAEDAAQGQIEPMLTPEQVANLLNVSKSTLCRLTKKNEIPHKRIGQRIVRYCRADIVAWMRERA
jgi:excisionase family DNA binding protein